MDIQALEARLAEIQARFEKWSVEYNKSHGWSGSLDDLREIYRERTEVERELALAKHEEAALPCEWEVPWDLGAPEPHIVASGRKTFMAYLTNEPDPNWDGT